MDWATLLFISPIIFIFILTVTGRIKVIDKDRQKK